MPMTLHVYRRLPDGTDVCLVPKHTIGSKRLEPNPVVYPPCGCPEHRGTAQTEFHRADGGGEPEAEGPQW